MNRSEILSEANACITKDRAAMHGDAEDNFAAISGGWKDDQGKLPYHLLAPEFLEATAAVLQFGAAKYAPRNWELGMDWSRPFSALMRHAWAWWRGEKADPETGFSHLHHAACCLMFLIAFEARKAGKDDRPIMMLSAATKPAEPATPHPDAGDMLSPASQSVQNKRATLNKSHAL